MNADILFGRAVEKANFLQPYLLPDCACRHIGSGLTAGLVVATSTASALWSDYFAKRVAQPVMPPKQVGIYAVGFVAHFDEVARDADYA